MDVFQYTTRFQGFRSQIGGLPGWAKVLVFAAAVPGIVLIGLSILALLVSILALLLPTVPLYRVLRALTAGSGSPERIEPDPFGYGHTGGDDPPRKRVEVTVIDPSSAGGAERTQRASDGAAN